MFVQRFGTNKELMTHSPHADLTGKTALVTGGTSGIGKEIARGLAERGASVIIAARDLERGRTAALDLTRSAGLEPDRVTALRLDLADLASVRGFAAGLTRRVPRLDLLVNNAGAWFTDRHESPDGHELTFATNVLGPVLLTDLLEGSLRAAGRGARIVNVVSSLAGHYDPEDLEWSRRRFRGFRAYAQSKQALRMLTWGMAGRLAETGITVNAVAPGFVRTGFNRNARGFVAAFIGLSARLFAVSPARGADTPLWAAVAPELAGVTGRYFEKRREKDGGFRDSGAIALLERRCREMIDAGRPASAVAAPDPATAILAALPGFGLGGAR